MIITSFDTGISTGIARYDLSEGSVSLYTVGMEKLKKWVEDPLLYRSEVVLLERLPVNSTPKLLVIQSFIETMVSERNLFYRFISPSEWKPVAKARNWKCSISNTQHEFDAYALLRYFFFIQHKDLGDI